MTRLACSNLTGSQGRPRGRQQGTAKKKATGCIDLSGAHCTTSPGCNAISPLRVPVVCHVADLWFPTRPQFALMSRLWSEDNPRVHGRAELGDARPFGQRAVGCGLHPGAVSPLACLEGRMFVLHMFASSTTSRVCGSRSTAGHAQGLARVLPLLLLLPLLLRGSRCGMCLGRWRSRRSCELLTALHPIPRLHELTPCSCKGHHAIPPHPRYAHWLEAQRRRCRVSSQ